MQFDVSSFNIEKFDEILARGLSCGIGNREGKMCIEAAICTAAADADAAAMRDSYLILAANIALQILRDMKSPGCKLLKGKS